jgi:hypothetical protein
MNNNKRDPSCFLYEKNKNSKSIFDYVTDVSFYKNDKQCADYTPPFLGYVQAGIPTINVDVENELRGADRFISKCQKCKYIPQNLSLATDGLSNVKSEYSTVQECEEHMKILPKSYLYKK